ncbi:glycoprotein endo-alpha-1,2-mannosidase isoform X1 [Callorhinchus milii]|uniref:glycoprotein endo-alpha-1,2-mannosidase isoform X1 n=1 Tax=Callorhinchus milii TaxID=7868 RepID=UPI001C3F8968|nr:glycoprotein endo-alpha-1,2-mannosidase isoform X1 [Callorhinchus milii]XP_007891113.2 glycoprotein endo-alpha-1,2-mannosidase isoform X1 [Callorhinchus milii]XP_042188893.1 glycoprotein endo-alpha-1,2-mannosidase isoform X1 [Callorhinchus milii]
MARIRRKMCITLFVFLLFVFGIMMGLKTLRPEGAGFGDGVVLELLPELHHRAAVDKRKPDLPNISKFSKSATPPQASKLIAGQRVTKSAPMSASIPENFRLVNSDLHAFYYMWYGNPKFDGKYLHWNHPLVPHWDSKIAGSYPKGRHNPPEDIGANFYPELGAYSSRDPAVINAHMKQFQAAAIGVVALSWYPPGMSDDNGEPMEDLVPDVLEAAHKYHLKVTLHIEPYKGRDGNSLYGNIKYIIDKYGSHPAFYRYKTSTGRNLPMFYIYDSYLTSPVSWATLFSATGSSTLRNSQYDGLFIALLVEEKHKNEILQAGFDGMYTYFATNGFSYGSSHHNWQTIKDFCGGNNLMFIPSVGPGYIDTNIRAWNNHNTRNRVNGKYYETALNTALLVRPEIITITSFNEWHEGTQIEKAVPRKSGQLTYLDYLPHKPDAYLELTRKWAEKFQQEKEQWLM